MVFADRTQAGELLAQRIAELGIGDAQSLVLALPRGGVPVAAPVARMLGCPLDVFLVRKLGIPGEEEYAMGAIASGGFRTINADIVRAMAIPAETIDAVARIEGRELARREALYRRGRPQPRIAGRTVFVVDDGLATGASMRVAVQALRAARPDQLVVAVPLAPESTCEELSALADRVVVLATPEPFRGVGMWYADFRQTTDAEVLAALHEAQLRCAA